MKIKNVIGFEGQYAITESGAVYNLKKGIEIKGHLRNGYKSVQLSKNGQSKNYSVHTLVFESFKGRRYKNLVVDHIDNNKCNNHFSNLRQVSTRINTSKGHALKAKYPTGVSKINNKYKAEIGILKERYYLGVFNTIDEASESYKDALKKWNLQGVKPFKIDRTKKLCSSCKTTKTVSEFYHVKNHGYSYLCKECHKNKMRNYRKKTRTLK